MLTQNYPSATSTFTIDRADRCGLFVSSLCVLHCLVLPAVITSIPVLISTTSPTTSLLQITSCSLSSVLAICAVSAGYRLHRSRSVISLAIAGVALQIGCAFMQSCQCSSVPNVIHAADCPCRESCGLMASECKYVARNPAISSAFSSISWMSPTGAILLVMAHLRNWQFRRSKPSSERRDAAHAR